MQHKKNARLSAAIVAALSICSSAALLAQGLPNPLPPQPLVDALEAFSRQSPLQVVYSAEVAKGVMSPGARAGQSDEETLRELLRDTGLTFEFVNERTVTVTREKSDQATPIRPVSLDGRASRVEQPAHGVRLASLQGEVSTSTEAASDLPPRDAADERNAVRLEELIVTGSRVRGAPPVSPVTTITQGEIKQAGYGDLGDVIRDIPQNFSGGQNPGGAVQFYSGPGNGNVTGGSALNLRGLGPDATLTLLNGRRLAFNGSGQAIDISAIPVEAVERIEIVADGASALYGSDAVAGVANVILKRDFDGMALGARYGVSTQGGGEQQQYSLVGGTTWESGGFIATYEYKKDEPILASDRDYLRYMNDPYMLYPQLERNSFLLSAHQDVAASATFSIDALYNERSQLATHTLSMISVGATDDINFAVAPSLTLALVRDWEATLSASYGKDEMRRNQGYLLLDGTPSFSYPEKTANRTESFEAGAEGAVMDLPGGQVRLALGAGYRRNEYSNVLDGAAAQGDQASHFGYAELHVPFIGAVNQVKLIERLSLNLAARYEDYAGMGDIATPKVGLVYSPTPDFDLKGSWGRSFKAPTLAQRYGENYVYLTQLADFGVEGYPADSTVMAVMGGNTDLQPEEATTWVGMLALHPRALPGLEAELSVFDVKYDQRVLSPYAAGQSVFSNPELADYAYMWPSPILQQGFIDLAAMGLTNYSGGDYIPQNVVVLQDSRFTNVSLQRINGVDLALRYRIDLQRGELRLTGNASWLDSEQRTLPGSPSFDLAGMVFNPPHLRGRAGLTWSTESWTTGMFVDHLGGVKDTFFGDGNKTASFTTVDASLAYRGRSAEGWLHGVEVILAVQNIFDREPPQSSRTSPGVMSYDPTNYSPVGRFLSVAIAKRW